MTAKAELLRRLEQLPESELVRVLEFARAIASPSSEEPAAATDEEVWRAHQDSLRERSEVYRRLANS